MEQFTASEVRDYLFSIEERSSRQWLIAHDTELGMLRQFADLLEAREKAVPVAYADAATREEILNVAMRKGGYGCEVPLFVHPAPADAEKRETMTPRELAKRIERGEKWKLADEPTPCQSRDADRLAEAVRNGLIDALRHQRQIDEDGAEVGVSRQAIDEAAAILSALAAHSAQAQPPAASVTDAMQELEDKYHELLWAVARKFPGETRHETALRYIREAECQEAALAAQENPNG